VRARRRSEEAPADELANWLSEGYAPAFRTAFVLLGNRADAEEAVQDAFLRAWRFRAAVPDGDGVRPWLYRVVVNASLSKLRSDGRRRAHVSPWTETGASGEGPTGPAGGEVELRGGGPEQRAIEGEVRQAVLDALADLPEHLRVVVVLRYYAQLSEKEIATVIHRRPGTVKSRLHEARSRLGDDERLAAMSDRDQGRVG
jgi:RNA polymerase sigma-70 factor, ECF subfamily